MSAWDWSAMTEAMPLAWPILLVVGIGLLVQATIIIVRNRRERKRVERIRAAVEEQSPIPADEFLEARRRLGARHEAMDVTGCYVLTNEDTGRSYVGQSTHVPDRVNAHLTGSGNGDVYADYRAGDRFSVRVIPLEGSGHARLDSLERELIAALDSYRNGYNRNRGNR